MQETQEMCFWSLGQKDSLEEGMATHSSILAWKIPWIEEPGGLESMGFKRVRCDWSNRAHTQDFIETKTAGSAECLLLSLDTGLTILHIVLLGITSFYPHPTFIDKALKTQRGQVTCPSHIVNVGQFGSETDTLKKKLKYRWSTRLC